jgi:hypothetical protein
MINQVKKNSTQEKAIINFIASLIPLLMANWTTVRLILPGGTYPIKLAIMPMKKVRMIIGDENNVNVRMCKLQMCK